MDPLKHVLVAALAMKAWAEEKYTKIALNDEGVSMIDAAIGIAIGLIVLVAVFSLAPVIGSNIDSSVNVPAGSQWNATENTDMITGDSLWTQNAGLLALAVMVSILSLVIFSIMAIRNRGTQ